MGWKTVRSDAGAALLDMLAALGRFADLQKGVGVDVYATLIETGSVPGCSPEDYRGPEVVAAFRSRMAKLARAGD